MGLESITPDETPRLMRRVGLDVGSKNSSNRTDWAERILLGVGHSLSRHKSAKPMGVDSLPIDAEPVGSKCPSRS